MSSRGGLPAHGPSLSPLLTVLSSHRIIFPPGRHLSPSYHTEVLHSLDHNPLHTHLPRPRHTCPIPNAEPLPPSKYLLTLHSADFETPFDNTMSHEACTYLVACLPTANVKYRTQHQLLHHCRLPLFNVRPQCLRSCLFEYTCHCCISPGPIPLLLSPLSCHLSEESHVQPPPE